MIFYHFTNIERIPILKKKGISIGDVPTSPGEGYNAPWVTDSPGFDNQGWACPEITAFDKTGARISIEIDEDDPKLMSWSAICAEVGVDPIWKDSLNDAMGGEGKGSGPFGRADNRWFVYHGVIAPDMFVTIDYRPRVVSFGHGKRSTHIMGGAVEFLTSSNTTGPFPEVGGDLASAATVDGQRLSHEAEERAKAAQAERARLRHDKLFKMERPDGSIAVAKGTFRRKLAAGAVLGRSGALRSKRPVKTEWHVPRPDSYEVLTDDWFDIELGEE